MKQLIQKRVDKTKNKINKWRGTGRLVFLMILSLSLGIFFLRQNNLDALRLYDKVIKADKYGGDLTGALTDLQHFSASHMNTELRQPVQLVETYNRAALESIKAGQEDTPENEAIYQEAQQECVRRGVLSTVIAECASNYAMSKIDPNYDPATPPSYQLPDQAEYTYSFASPYWTPDFAGLSLAVFGLSSTILLFRSILHLHASRVLNKRNRAKKS
jgi:hypothetical protein